MGDNSKKDKMIAKYSKKFPYAPYLNEDIGFDMGLPDDATDEEMIAAIVRLNDVAEKAFKKLNPGAIVEVNPEYSHLLNQPQQVKTINRQDQNKEDCLVDIANSKNTDDLNLCKKLAEECGLMEEWNNRLNEFNFLK